MRDPRTLQSPGHPSHYGFFVLRGMAEEEGGLGRRLHEEVSLS